MGNLAIIPARGGSKRILNKNIRTFIDKPIIAYSVQAAIDSDLFEEVMVSTENEEIAKVAKKYGATVPYARSEKNADDYATLMDVVMEVLEWYESKGKVFDNVCCLLATAPFVTSARLREGYDKLVQGNFSAVFTVVKFSYPIQRALRIDSQHQNVRMADPAYLKTRSQDLEPYYHDCGQFYWGKTSAVKKERAFFTSNAGALELSGLEVQDIDTEEDWMLAEQKYKVIKQV